MRIVGGSHRGRILKGPEGPGTRPTSDRAREAVFNILAHAPWISGPLPEDALVLDIFAGTGALGLEALSRGAAHAVFIEQDRKAAAVCRENLRLTGLEAQAQLMTIDALSPPPRPAAVVPRTLVFLDPPYGLGMGAQALAAFAAQGWLAPKAICVLEMAKKQAEEAVPGFDIRDERRYGIAQVRFMEWTG